MQALHDPMAEMEELARQSGQKGCAFCGGLGHRIADCPKLASQVGLDCCLLSCCFSAHVFAKQWWVLVPTSCVLSLLQALSKVFVQLVQYELAAAHLSRAFSIG